MRFWIGESAGSATDSIDRLPAPASSATFRYCISSIARNDQERVVMGLREFEDAGGRSWRVWDTYPSAASGSDDTALAKFMKRQPGDKGVQPLGVRSHLAAGWLTFGSGDERKRISPVPADWQTCDLAHLRQLLERAEVVKTRSH
jgi:hypothetical protein